MNVVEPGARTFAGASRAQPALSIRGLTKRYRPDLPPAVDGLDLDLAAGEIVALIGPSGCGKTTTLRMIAGFESVDAGSIVLGGEDVGALPPERRRIGIVFQDYALFPHLSVLGNVEFGLRGLRRDVRLARALKWIDRVGLRGLSARMPHELSGGQQQRVALARTLAVAPRLVLLDEPFSNLDAQLRVSMRREVRALLKSAGASVILVTHDQDEALAMADRVGVMHAARLEQVDTPERVYARPASAFVARFLGRTNLVSAQAHGAVAQTCFGTIPIRPRAEGAVTLSIRPEHLALVRARRGDGHGVIIEREFHGHDLSYRVRVGDVDYQVRTDFARDFQPGDQVSIEVREPVVVLTAERYCDDPEPGVDPLAGEAGGPGLERRRSAG
jgi:iron(III) transport system ATP-binding protein